MKRTTTFQASLVITLIGSEDPTGLIERSLTLIQQLNLACTLGFPSAWLPTKRNGINHPFPQLPDHLEQLLWDLTEKHQVQYIPTGFSGVAETNLPETLLEKERTWSHRPPHRLEKVDSTKFSPWFFPLVPDLQRKIGLVDHPVKFDWFFRGWVQREGIWLAQWGDGRGDLVRVPWIDGTRSAVPLQSQVKKILHTFGPSTIPIIHAPLYQSKDMTELEKALAKIHPDPRKPTPSKPSWSWLSLTDTLKTTNPILIDKPVKAFSSPIVIPMSPCLSIERINHKNRSVVEQLSQYTQSCNIESIPHTLPTPAPERELIASMLGSATLMGDFMEAQFENGLLVQLRGTFGGTRGMGVRVPSLELEHRKIYWTVESAFSFETSHSRGLRQVSVLTNELFTLAGRMVSDYVFFDDFPALVVDIRVQHPWIDKSYPIDQYTPWPLEIWQHPNSSPTTFQGLLPNQSGKSNPSLALAGIDQKTDLTQDYSHRVPKRKILNLLANQSIDHDRAYLPAQAWDMPCAQGTLRIRRADTLLDPTMMIPGQIITSAQQDNFSVTLCPTFSYLKVDSSSLRGIQEHFCILIYDPNHEAEVLGSARKAEFKGMYTPWLIRG